MALLDCARFLAVSGIIYHHSYAGSPESVFTPLGTMGVPFYVFASVFMIARSLRSGTGLRHCWKVRTLRLLPVFVVWNLVYFAYFTLRHIHHPQRQPELFDPANWMEGTGYHLWFLPLLLATNLLDSLLIWICVKAPRIRVLVFTGCFMAAILVCVMPVPEWLLHESRERRFLFLCWRQLPAILSAVPVGWWLARLSRRSSPRKAVASFGAALLLGGCVAQWLGGSDFFLRHFCGLGLLLLSFFPLPGDIRVVNAVAFLGRRSYGIFLVHLIFLDILQTLGSKLPIPHELVRQPLVLVSTLLLSTGTAVVAHRMIARWVPRAQRTCH